MGATVSRTDFDWVYTEEPHATRRKLILEKYGPQMKKLMGVDSNMKYYVALLVTLNIFLTYLVKDASWLVIIAIGYLVGGVINHALTLAIHEIAHNLAFGHTRPLANRALGMFANLPIGLPMSISFRKYHLEHHKYQGDDERDVDIPSRMETVLFTNTFTKFIWVLLQPFFYGIRPLFVRPKSITGLEAINVVLQFAFNYVIYTHWGGKALFYMIGGSLMAMGLHPVAGHFISEHYVFVKGYETYSYYGPLNWVTFNVGYHNEHHDFPNIPGSRLSQVKKIAPEFYDNLPCHTSWSKVIYDFITDPDVGPYARVKRNKWSDQRKDVSANGVHSNGDAHIGNGNANGVKMLNGHTKSDESENCGNGHANGNANTGAYVNGLKQL